MDQKKKKKKVFHWNVCKCPLAVLNNFRGIFNPQLKQCVLSNLAIRTHHAFNLEQWQTLKE